MLKDGDERMKALLLLAFLDVYQSKSMRVNMKEPVELEPMKKIDELRRKLREPQTEALEGIYGSTAENQ